IQAARPRASARRPLLGGAGAGERENLLQEQPGRIGVSGCGWEVNRAVTCRGATMHRPHWTPRVFRSKSDNTNAMTARNPFPLTRLRLFTTLAALTLLGAASLRAENWAQWRGPSRNGPTPGTNPPSTRSTTENANWTAPRP